MGTGGAAGLSTFGAVGDEPEVDGLYPVYERQPLKILRRLQVGWQRGAFPSHVMAWGGKAFLHPEEYKEES